MTIHALGIGAATALITLITLLPFLPGTYDPLAVPLSTMARVFGLLSPPPGAGGLVETELGGPEAELAERCDHAA